MRVLFLSFNYKYIKPLLCGLKKYEYRKRFCNEESICYLYLSGKPKKVIGVLELGKPLKLEKIINNYNKKSAIYKRINKYIEQGVKNAVPIKKLSLYKNPISIDELRKEFPNFMPPQMYYDLNNNQLLLDYLSKIPLEKEVFEHDHSIIFEDNICVSVNELEQTELFKNEFSKYKNIYDKFN